MNRVHIFLGLIIAVVSFALGWLLSPGKSTVKSSSSNSHILREDGFTFVSPLLLAEYGNSQTSKSLAPLEDTIKDVIDKKKTRHAVTDVSVYYRDLTSYQQLVVNDQTRYYPASLNKVPLLMAVYKKAETNPSLLSKVITANFDTDYNQSQEVAPAKYPLSGQKYSIQELLDMVVVHSDNTGFHLVTAEPGITEAMMDIYNDLRIDYPINQLERRDVFTAREFSRLFRILYNATYMRPETSEKALEMLGRVKYANGIKAGVPNNIVLAHKFGQGAFKNSNGVIKEREFHDCGIVYKPDHPYILCVMTKSSAEIKEIESVIAEISKHVYEYIR